MGESVSFIFFGCTHCPEEDPEAIAWLKAQIVDFKPDYVIHGGDLLEANGASRWPSENPITLEEEYAAANKLLTDIRLLAEKMNSKAKCVFLPGNHDANILEECRIDRKLRGVCDYKKHILELKNWKQPCEYIYDRKRGVFSLGNCHFAHGNICSGNSDEIQAILLGRPYGLFCSVHTHRWVQVARAMKNKSTPLPYWYANAGCLRDLKPHYMKRKASHMWSQGCIVGTTELNKSPREHRTWTAEARLFRMADEL